MNRRTFLVGGLCACPTAALAQSFTFGGRSFASRKAFIDGGLRCGTRTPTLYEQRRAQRTISALRSRSMEVEGGIRIPVRCNVIHNDNTGKLTNKQVEDQVAVLNTAYKPARIEFSLADVQFHNRPEWFHMGPGSGAEREAKTALGREQAPSLNIYTAGLPRNRGLLGWATFPWDREGAPTLDGVVLLHRTLPGNSEGPFNLGMTGVHEVGHWLGLYHTFQGGCAEPGDSVPDTPFEAQAAYGCPVGRDSCPALPGSDPIRNYMNYSDDTCLTGFSAGQMRRMREFTAVYRTPLVEPEPAVAAARRPSRWNPAVLREIREQAE